MFDTSNSVCPKVSVSSAMFLLYIFGWEVEVVEGRENHLTAGDEGRSWGLRYSIWRFSTKFFTPMSHTAPVSSDPELSKVVCRVDYLSGGQFSIAGSSSVEAFSSQLLSLHLPLPAKTFLKSLLLVCINFLSLYL